MILYKVFFGKICLTCYNGFDSKLATCTCLVLGTEISFLIVIDNEHTIMCMHYSFIHKI
jgi:hypothetical protein